MRTHETIAALRAALNQDRKAGKSIAFVPTMGNLHAGHMELVRQARNRADVVVVSIFVNPLQFGANEDLDSYPRTLAADKQKLFAEGVQYLFYPGVEEMYPNGMEQHTQVSVPGGLADTLCGASRPGHFTGVATVVSKLLQIVQPDVALFGKKDFQQLAVIRKLVNDLQMPVEIIGIDTARDKDGLALSSRNGYLSTRERKLAPAIHELLRDCREAIACGYDNFVELEHHAQMQLARRGFRPDYFAIRDARDLGEPRPDTEELVLLAAAWLGKTRLIDNTTLNLNPNADWGMLAAN